MADKETAEQEDKKPQKGSKKLLIIGILAGLALGGGGVGAVMMLGGKSKPEGVEQKPVVEKPKLNLHFVKVEKVTIPLVIEGRVSGNIVFDFSMEVDGNENKMAVIQNLPAIRDAILRHFSVTPLGEPDDPHNIDYILLKKTIKNISNKILHDPLVRKVMVVQVRRF